LNAIPEDQFIIFFLQIEAVEKIKGGIQEFNLIHRIMKQIPQINSKFNQIYDLHLKITKLDNVEEVKRLVLPENLVHLSVSFERSFNQTIVDAHVIMANKIQQQKSLQSLKIEGLGIMHPSIDKAWAECLLNNTNIRSLKFKSSMQ
jgi:hypothetical protein